MPWESLQQWGLNFSRFRGFLRGMLFLSVTLYGQTSHGITPLPESSSDQFAEGFDTLSTKAPNSDSLALSPGPDDSSFVTSSTPSSPPLKIWKVQNPWSDSISKARDQGYLQATWEDSGWSRGPLHVIEKIRWTDENGAALSNAIQFGAIQTDENHSEEIQTKEIQVNEIQLFDQDRFIGKPVSQETLKSLGEKALFVWTTRGFPFAEVHPYWQKEVPKKEQGQKQSGQIAEISLKPSSASNIIRMSLELRVEKNGAYKFGGFRTRGTLTTEETLLRLSLLEIGDDFLLADQIAANNRLERTGYFAEVKEVGWYRDSLRHFIYPRLIIQDYPGNRLGGLLGFDTERPDGDLNGYVDIHLINLFGTARNLDFSFSSTPIVTGGSEQDVQGIYREPWLFGSDIDLEVRGSLRLQDSTYWEYRRELAFQQPLDFRSSLTWSLGDQENQDGVFGDRSQAFFSAIGWKWDGRDRVPATRQGGIYSIEAGGWRREFSDTAYFYTRWEAQAEYVFPLSKKFLGKLGLRNGGHWPLKDKPNRGELFELGGAKDLRGYREKAILTGLFSWGLTEIQYLLAGESRLFAFASPGGARTPETNRGWKPLLGYGTGLAVGSRSFLVEITLASNPERSLGEALLHVKALNQF
jgi:hypothetical protein